MLTDRQTNKNRQKHNLLGGGNNAAFLFHVCALLLQEQSTEESTVTYRQTVSESTAAASQSVVPVPVSSVMSTGQATRSWAGRRQPYLQQNKAVTARSAAVSASEKISELSVEKLELAKLRKEAETERKTF